jgi:phage shock protein C
MVSGVCGGIAEYLNLDPTVVRLLWVLAAFLTGFIPAIIAYIVMLFIVPEAPQEPEK